MREVKVLLCKTQKSRSRWLWERPNVNLIYFLYRLCCQNNRLHPMHGFNASLMC